MRLKQGQRLPPKRRLEKKTDYRLRLDLLKSEKPRLVVRKSHREMHIQVVDFEMKGDKTLLEVDSKALTKMGWTLHTGSLPAAYLTGYMAGKKAVAAGIKAAVLDTGLGRSTTGSALYAAAKGAADAGLEIPLSEEVVPDEDRLKGAHIAAYAKKLRSNAQEFAKQFGKSKDVERTPEIFEAVKKRIEQTGGTEGE
jgi:large subunit ribosomal protein L18